MTEKKRSFWKWLASHFLPYKEDKYFLEDLSNESRESLLLKLERDKAKQKLPLWLSWICIFLYLISAIFIFGISNNNNILILVLWTFIFSCLRTDYTKYDMGINLVKALDLLEEQNRSNRSSRDH